MTTIVLAEDHHVVRQGFRALLESESDFRVVGEAENGLDAVSVTVEHEPDILLVDVMMPDLNGLEVTREIVQRSLTTRTIILSMHANEAYVLQALKNGAAGYVLKGNSADDLIEAVRTVAAGRRYLSPPLSERAIEVYLQRAESHPVEKYESLTPRERQVLHLVAEGYTNAEVAERLTISTRTVETHRANLMRKLELDSHTDLIRFALKRGLIPLDK